MTKLAENTDKLGMTDTAQSLLFVFFLWLISFGSVIQAQASPGCDVINDPSLDGLSSGVIIAPLTYFPGEEIVISAGEPTSGVPTTLEFKVDGTLLYLSIPGGGFSHEFLSAQTVTVGWIANGGGVTWSVECNSYLSTVVFDSNFVLPSLTTGDGQGTPVCVDETSGLIVAGCEGAVGPEGPQGEPGNLALANQACPAGQFIYGYDSVGDILCSGTGALGTSCSSTNNCVQGSECVDGSCCDSACDGVCAACNLSSFEGTCTAIPLGMDPDNECDGASCFAYYWGWTGDVCYRKADVTDQVASCNGSFQCQTTAQLCGSSGKGSAAIDCDDLCQEPTGGTCVGITAGYCSNINPGDTTCGLGVCQVTVPQCINGSQNSCIPNWGQSSTEICNGLDDDCDGTIDEGC